MSDDSMIVSNPENRTDDGTKFSFTIDSNADCFCFYSLAKTPATYFNQLTNQTGQFLPETSFADLYSNKIKAKNNYKGFAVSHTDGITAFSTPIAEASKVTLAGTWSGVRVDTQGQNSDPSMTIVQRIRDSNRQVNGYGLKLNIAIYADRGVAQFQSYIKAAEAFVSRIFAQADISCSFSKISVYPIPTGGISTNFNDPNTKSAVAANAATDAISVIFVQNLTAGSKLGPGKTEGGRAGGIPGPQGFITNRSAVLINLDTGPSSVSATDIREFAITIAHEVGHYLGLKHWPDERPVAPTEQQMQNLMYYTPNGTIRNRLEPVQTFIMRNMPIVEIVYVDRELSDSDKTPVETLEVEITTGDRTFLGSPTDNENMGLTLQLGSDEAGYQSWVLAASDNGGVFAPGQTTNFPITSIDNLFMEDLVTWSADVDWTDPSSQPMRFATSTDYWDFLRIKITANGIVVTDTEVGKILTWVGQHSLVQKIGS